MKNISLIKFSFIILQCLLFVFFLSCKKSDPGSLSNSFTWTYNGNNFTAAGDSAYFNFSGDAVIVAGKNADPAISNEKFLIILPSFAVGTNTFGISTASLIYTDDAGHNSYSTSGSLNITNNKDNLISGNFSATLTNTKIISGQFTGMPVKP